MHPSAKPMWSDAIMWLMAGLAMTAHIWLPAFISPADQGDPTDAVIRALCKTSSQKRTDRCRLFNEWDKSVCSYVDTSVKTAWKKKAFG